MGFRRIATSMAVLSSLLVAGIPTSSAQSPAVGCGTVLTENVRLTQDLSCPGDGLIVGAGGITINLGGHTLEGVGGGAGIDNRAGHDQVRVRNGTVRGFDVGITLAGAEQNRLIDLSVARNRPSGIGILLEGSNANRIVRVHVSAGDPAVRLSGSDFNRIADSEIEGGVAIRVGNDVELHSGSDANRIAGSHLHGVAQGFSIFDSDRNVVTGSVTQTDGGNVLARAQNNRIDGNSLFAELSLSNADQNTIRHNVLVRGRVTGVSVTGSRNRVVGNSIPASFDLPAITVTAGLANLVEDNLIRSSLADGIWVREDAQRTRLLGNTASRGGDDGIDVDAPGTVLGWNRTDGNADLGIEAVDGVIDWGGNRASENGNPLQCTGVACS